MKEDIEVAAAAGTEAGRVPLNLCIAASRKISCHGFEQGVQRLRVVNHLDAEGL